MASLMVTAVVEEHDNEDGGLEGTDVGGHFHDRVGTVLHELIVLLSGLADVACRATTLSLLAAAFNWFPGTSEHLVEQSKQGR